MKKTIQITCKAAISMDVRAGLPGSSPALRTHRGKRLQRSGGKNSAHLRLYGKMSEQSLEEFLSENELDMNDLLDELELPALTCSILAAEILNPPTKTTRAGWTKRIRHSVPPAAMNSPAELKLHWCRKEKRVGSLFLTGWAWMR
jgi:hypothetical protein